ncbi:MAG: DNA polymerase subunit beta [Calditrichaeota bacterium]|nr:DNA polymerase subunit beta [Calditrichota bacterium]
MSNLIPKIGYDSDALATLCRKWRILRLALFGSVLRDDFRPDSDVDVVVSYDPDSHWSLWDVVDLQNELKDLFGRDVDIVEIEAVTNPISRKIILGSMQYVYEE